MIDVDKTFRAEFDFGKLTKANSIVINTRVVYISKKDCTGTNTKTYIAFDYLTKIQLGFSTNKEKLIEMLNRLIDNEVIKVLNN